MAKLQLPPVQINLDDEESAILSSVDGKDALKAFTAAVKTEFLGAAQSAAALTRGPITSEKVETTIADVARTETILAQLPDFEGKQRYLDQLKPVKVILGELQSQAAAARQIGEEVAARFTNGR